MRYLLFASHGMLAEGILHTVEMITGKQKNIWTLSAYLDEKVDLQSQVHVILKKLGENDELIVVTDIFGGSVNNEFMNLLEDPRIHLIAGLNLPLAIELASLKDSAMDSKQLITAAVRNSRNSIRYCNTEVERVTNDEEF